jgi:hypothetical protein
VTDPTYELWSVKLKTGNRLSKLRAFDKRVLKRGTCAYGRVGNRILAKTAYCGASCFASSIGYHSCEQIKETELGGGVTCVGNKMHE